MTRTTLNLCIDTLALGLFALLSTTGVLMRYLLPPGSGRFTLAWSLDRHGWGALHFWIAVAFLTALVVHLALHWKWILCAVSGPRRGEARGRLALGGIGLLGIVALALAPLLAPIERVGVVGSSVGDHASAAPHANAPDAGEHPVAEDHSINGQTTVAELLLRTGLTTPELGQALGAEGLRPDDRLGPLRRRYGFEMQEVRGLVARHEKPATH